MKVLKIALLIVWAILSVGLFMYSQMMKVKAVKQEMLHKEAREVTKEMSITLDEYFENMVLLRNDSLNTIDIDSIFEKSFFLSNYEK